MLFSIIVPVYNVEKYLDKCIKSILSQTYKNFELILVNDGSTDNSLDICNKYKSKDSRVEVINKENGGHSSARLAGINKALGDYIVSVDSDDWIKKTLLEYSNNIIKKYSAVDIIAFGIEEKHDKKTIYHKYSREYIGYFTKKQLEKKYYPKMFIDGWKKNALYNSGCTKIIKKEILRNCYCNDCSIVMGEDFCFSYECMYNANCIYFSNECFYVYNRINKYSLTATRANILEPNVFRYVKSRFKKNDQIVNKQIDYVFIKTIMQIINTYTSTKKSINYILKKLESYQITDEVSPQIKINDLMNSKEKKYLMFLKNNKAWRIIYSFDYLYKLIDYRLWEKRCKIQRFLQNK